MPIYKTTLKGRRDAFLFRAKNASEARDALVELEALTADKMAAALEAGDKVYKAGDDLPADKPEPPKAEADDEPKAE
jgi:hypothetical protein